MAFVISKDTFDELKNWYTTRLGQAVPVIDNEQNIQSYTLLLHLRRTIADLIGNGTSNDGFLLSGVATDPDIGEGNIFICGLKIEQWAAIKESTQPNGTQTPPAGDGLWYLKIVLKALTPGDDATLIDADTGIQSIDALQVDWTLLKVLGGLPLPTPGADEILFLLAVETTGAFTDMRNSGTVDAGANTGFENREGGQPGDGHTHDDVKIIVDDPGYVSTDVDGALTEIDARLDSIEIGGAPPLLHASTHEIAGSDMIALDNIDGSLADEKVILTGDVGGNANLEEHVQDGAIHAGAGAPDDASYVTINAEGGLSNETLHSDIDHSSALATSALSDLGSRDHSELTNIQGGGEHHLSGVNHLDLTDGGLTTLHTHPALGGLLYFGSSDLLGNVTVPGGTFDQIIVVYCQLLLVEAGSAGTVSVVINGSYAGGAMNSEYLIPSSTGKEHLTAIFIHGETNVDLTVSNVFNVPDGSLPTSKTGSYIHVFGH